MYTVTMYNRTDYLTLQASDGKFIPPNETWLAEKLGHAWFANPHFGMISVVDMGQVHIGGDSKETWGVLVSYQGAKVVGRYEGKAGLNMEINQWGQVTLSGAGMDFRQVLAQPFQLVQ